MRTAPKAFRLCARVLENWAGGTWELERCATPDRLKEHLLAIAERFRELAVSEEKKDD